MKMSKNYKKLCLVLGLSGIVGAGAVTAQSGTQNVQATYRNIQVTYNGVNQSMATEPFLVNGSVYVPLRAVGDIFGASANWEPTTNTVILTGGSSTSSSAEIANLQYQVATLTQQLNAANTELATYKSNSNSSSSSTTTSGSSITTAQLKDTENYLNSNLSDALSSNITMYYELSLSGNQINVNMSYESKSENTAYEKLSQSKIESFMKKIGDNIAATHSDIAINGTITYTKDDEEKASFTRTKASKYSYSHAFDSSSLQSAIEDETSGYFYFNNMNPGYLTISGYDVTIREAKSTVNVKVFLSTSANFKTAWGTNAADAPMTSSQRKSAVIDQLEDIQDAVTDIATDYDVNVYVYYGNNSSDLIAQIDSDGSVTTDGVDA